jgi:short-subunit dehydrogenase
MSKRAIITGASSGIGAELARVLARRGWSVALLARRTDLLDEVAGSIGASAVAVPCDVTDADSVRAAVRSGEEALGGPFDLAVANAGVGGPTHATKFNVSNAERMVRVNILGMMYLFDAVMPGMVERRSGRFAGVASLAGLRGLPTSSVYSATKSAMQSFLEASRGELALYGIKVTTVNPGFIDTPMTEKNKFKMPFLMNVGDAARIIADGIERGARVVEFPWPLSLALRIVRFFPAALYDFVTAPYGRRKIDPSKVKR